MSKPIEFHLQKQRLYIKPGDPLPIFTPTPRAIRIIPIYGDEDDAYYSDSDRSHRTRRSRSRSRSPDWYSDDSYSTRGPSSRYSSRYSSRDHSPPRGRGRYSDSSGSRSYAPSASHGPSRVPSKVPSAVPSKAPSAVPIRIPPSHTPSRINTQVAPSHAPSFISHKRGASTGVIPSRTQSLHPSHVPSHVLSHAPSRVSSHAPSHSPSYSPSHAPSYAPSYAPSHAPSHAPSRISGHGRKQALSASAMGRPVSHAPSGVSGFFSRLHGSGTAASAKSHGGGSIAGRLSRFHAPSKTSFESSSDIAVRSPREHRHALECLIKDYCKVIPPSRKFAFSRCIGRKKAVCVGINYTGQRNELNGCVNDAHHMRDYLISFHGFKSEDVLILADDGKATALPTRKEMLDAMHWLVEGAHKDDSLFFHYSGHGAQEPDDSGRELDGYDEVIFPVDYEDAGVLVDDELFKVLVQPLPPGCRLTAVFDACHSGTVLDLPYLHSAHGRLRSMGHISRRALKRGEAPSGDVICFAGCKDDETAADTFVGGVATGAMSYALIQSLKDKPHQTYDELLMHLRHILVPKYHQKPQISGTHPLDLDRQFTL